MAKPQLHPFNQNLTNKLIYYIPLSKHRRIPNGIIIVFNGNKTYYNKCHSSRINTYKLSKQKNTIYLIGN